jgi:hypothetical protein
MSNTFYDYDIEQLTLEILKEEHDYKEKELDEKVTTEEFLQFNFYK